jgi:hypothetical protein
VDASVSLKFKETIKLPELSGVEKAKLKPKWEMYAFWIQML